MSMTNRTSFAAALVAALASASGSPAVAADGEVLITHAKALAGNITPGDAPGYPITLSRTGSYKLGGNLIPGPDKKGIEITGSFVTLDMGGFALHGSNRAGIGISGDGEGAWIENGTIAGFKVGGINTAGRSWTIEDMRITGNGGKGIYLDGEYGRLLHSTLTDNVQTGINCRWTCLVEGNMISGNGGGVAVYAGTVLGNAIVKNKSYGLIGGDRLGYGNNTIADNSGGAQTWGTFQRLFPNACYPGACP